MGEPRGTRASQVETVIERLREEYPDATISLEYASRYELLVAVILSAQCTDVRVNETTPELFAQYPTPADLASAEIEEITEIISSITYPNSKAEYLKGVGETLVEDHDGQVPDTMSALTDLPGVGRKTANVVLQHGHDVTEGIVVDTHVIRLSRRLAITDEERRNRIEEDLMTVVPEEHWQQYTHLLIAHGRAVCTAQNPDCGSCVLEDRCPSSTLDADVDLASGEPWDGS